MPERCVDCRSGSRLNEVQSCYTETFTVTGPLGMKYPLTLRLCLACGSRFADRQRIREYLRTRIPAHARSAVEAVAV